MFHSKPKFLEPSNSFEEAIHTPIKKCSISTLATNSGDDLDNSRVRKVSIYSYYDAENDITFLSND